MGGLLDETDDSQVDGLKQTHHRVIVACEYKYLLKRGGIVINKL